MKASKSLLIFLFGTSAIQTSNSQTLINPDGISTADSLPANSLSGSIGSFNNTSVGNWGNGTPGGNLLMGSGNTSLSSDSSFSGGLYNSVSNQEGSFVFGFFNDASFPVNTYGQANMVFGYSNIIRPNSNYAMTWGAIVLGDSNETSAEDSWVIGRGNIGQNQTLTVGTFAQTENNAALIVGKGSEANQRSNGLVVFRNGNTEFGGDLKVPTNKGVYFGSSTLPTLSMGAGGSAIFPSGVSAPNGLQISGGNLVISSNTASSSSATGALSVAGGVGIGMDSWINGVRIGRGSGNVASNTVIGNGGLNANSSASSNTAVGNLALAANISGSSNTALGNEALKANTTGGGNTAIGPRVLKSSLTGIGNTGIGVNTLQANVNGSNNLAAGLNSQYYNVSGGSNISVGNLSLYFNSSGSSNIAIGYAAARFQADGIAQLTDPESSIYIGNNSRGFNNSDNNSIVIGANAIGEGANTTVIGNAATMRTKIFGDLEVGGGLSLQFGGISHNSTHSVNFVGGYADPSASAVSMQNSFASGFYSFAAAESTAAGEVSSALSGGYSSGLASTAMSSGVAEGDYSLAAGPGSIASAYYSVSLGSNTASWGTPSVWVETDPAFLVGNGENGPSNAITTLKNGQTRMARD